MSKEEVSFKNRDRFIQLGIVIAAEKDAWNVAGAARRKGEHQQIPPECY